MAHVHETQISTMRIRNRSALHNESILAASEKPSIDWNESPKKHRSEEFLKNLAVASALVLCAVTLKTGALPSINSATDAVMTAATDSSLLDAQLGKLSFVSTLFPEAVLVFGEKSFDTLSLPVNGGAVVHTWTANEPFMSWRTNSREVISASDGEVAGIYHGNGDELIVRISGSDGISCLYGNLSHVNVQVGDDVSVGETIGRLMGGEDFVFEVQRDGVSIDPVLFLPK